MTAAEVLASNLGHLQHPSGAVVSIPGFDRTAHPDLIEAHGMLAILIGEAAIHTLQQAGHIVTTPDQLRDDTAPDPWVTVRCNQCRHELFRLNTVNPEHVLADTAVLAEALSAHTKECR